MDEKLALARDRLMQEIRDEARATASWTGRPAFSEAVMAAMATVPRHAFVPPGEASFAYVNRPRPIGHGQTISQPYIVALMTDLLDLAPHHRVLEIGCGCGYQAAVLAALAARVVSLEIVEALARDAAARLARLGIANVEVRHADGHAGWPDGAPYDRVIVTAAARAVPPALVEQLAPGGRMVVPIGAPHETQSLELIVKDADGAATRRGLLPVAFVPMTGGQRRR